MPRLIFQVFKWYQSLAYNVDLTRYLVFVFCKCYLTNSGAKGGIFCALQLVSRFKVPSLIPQHHLVDITSLHFQSLHICKPQSKLIGGMTLGIHGNGHGLHHQGWSSPRHQDLRRTAQVGVGHILKIAIDLLGYAVYQIPCKDYRLPNQTQI